MRYAAPPPCSQGFHSFVYCVPATPTTSRVFERTVPYGSAAAMPPPAPWKLLTDPRARAAALTAL